MAVRKTIPTACCKICHTSAAELKDNFKRCSACKDAKYCSKACQKADWSEHKKVCTHEPKSKPAEHKTKQKKVISERQRAKTSGNQQDLAWYPFQLLHSRTSREVYSLLIDAFRLRIEDAYVLEHKIVPRSLYDEAEDNGEGLFLEFLDQAEKHGGLLPDWWNKTSVKECIELGKTATFSNLFMPVNEDEIAQWYRNVNMPSILRLLGEAIHGRDSYKKTIQYEH